VGTRTLPSGARAANFAISNPAREILFTVVGREHTYKCKNVIDTLVFRGGNAVSGWMFAGLKGMGLELAAVALAAVPLMLVWLAVALALGRRQEQLAAASTS
jgi:AAA family ATP:ADP antiporter